jgi:hypothetical protein
MELYFHAMVLHLMQRDHFTFLFFKVRVDKEGRHRQDLQMAKKKSYSILFPRNERYTVTWKLTKLPKQL